MLSLCPFDISVGVWAFVIGLSQISSFFSYRTSSACSLPGYGIVNHGFSSITWSLASVRAKYWSLFLSGESAPVMVSMAHISHPQHNAISILMRHNTKSDSCLLRFTISKSDWSNTIDREGECSDRRYLALVLTCARAISLWLSGRTSDLRSRGRWFEPRWW